MMSLVQYTLLGLDSFIVCIGLGAVIQRPPSWPLIALAFGGADALGTALGGMFQGVFQNVVPHLTFAAPVAVAAYGIVVFLATARVRNLVASRIGLVLLPVLLSFDNFAAAAAGDDDSMSWSAAFLATAIMAYIGCAFGAALTRQWPFLERGLPAGAAAAAAAMMCFS